MTNHSTSGAFLKTIDRISNFLLGTALVAISYVILEGWYVPHWQRGEYGGDLRALRRYHTAPKASGQSNHIIDMLKSGSFTEFLRIHGLTNNHALFVLSHGRAITNVPVLAPRYAYYPDRRVLSSDNVPYFSARDLAKVLGPKEAAEIHNIILAGCNIEGAFDPIEIRRYFVNATNITHTPAGKNGFEFVFRHGIMYSAEGIRLLYTLTDSFSVGDFTEKPPVYQRFSKLSPYVAELYKPGAQKPFKTQFASRELLGGAPLTLAYNATPTGTNFSSLLASAMAALENEPAPEPAKPFILVSANGRAPKSRLNPEPAEPLGGMFRYLTFSFLGIWRSPVLMALMSLALIRLGILCISVAVRKQKPEEAAYETNWNEPDYISNEKTLEFAD